MLFEPHPAPVLTALPWLLRRVLGTARAGGCTCGWVSSFTGFFEKCSLSVCGRPGTGLGAGDTRGRTHRTPCSQGVHAIVESLCHREEFTLEPSLRYRRQFMVQPRQAAGGVCSPGRGWPVPWRNTNREMACRVINLGFLRPEVPSSVLAKWGCSVTQGASLDKDLACRTDAYLQGYNTLRTNVFWPGSPWHLEKGS